MTVTPSPGPIPPTTQLHCDPRETEKTIAFSAFLMVLKPALAYRGELKRRVLHLTVQRPSKEIYDDDMGGSSVHNHTLFP